MSDDLDVEVDEFAWFRSLSDEDQALYLELLEKVAGEQWNLASKQRLAEAVWNKVDWLFYGGAAGGGKSELALKHANDLSINHPGHATLIIRQSIPELRRSIILRMVVRKAQFKLPAKLRKVDGVTQFKYDNTSFIECGYLATDENLGQYLSAEYGCIIVDEASLMTPNQIVSVASRLRITTAAAKQGARTHLGLFSNPGGASHGWLRDIFVTPTDYGNRIVVYDISQGIENATISRTYTAPVPIEGATDETIDEILIPWVEGLDLQCDPETELACAFVPAKATDNPHIDPSFMRGLNALPAKRRRQLRDGDFDIFDGMFFDEWSRDVHVCDPFDIPESWTRARAADFGHAAPWCCLWGAWDNDGDLWIYREAYGSGLTPIEQARQAKQMSEMPALDGRPRAETYWATVGDPSVFTNTRGTGKTIAQMWRENGFQVTKAKNARVAGWANVRQYLWDAEGDRARLHVFNNCENLIRTLPLQQRDKRNIEDLDSTLEDHAPDCLRYIAALRPIGTRPPPTKLGLTIDARWSKLVSNVGKRKRSLSN